MENCPKCNEALEAEAKFCTKCGYSEEYAPPANLENNTAEETSTPRPGGTGGQTPNAELMTRAREVLKPNWGLAIGTYLVYAVITGVIQSVPYLGGLAWLFLAGPFALGLAAFGLSFSRQENAELGMIFSGFNDFGRPLVGYLLMALYLFGWTLLLVVPGIIKAYSYSMTFYILKDDPSISGSDAITKSRQIMDGNKLKLFFMFCRFIGWSMLCVLTLGIGFLWLMPYMAISMAKFYDDIATV